MNKSKDLLCGLNFNSVEQLQVNLIKRHGIDLLDIRIWITHDESITPTHKGFTIRVDDAELLGDVIFTVENRLKEKGLIKEETPYPV